MRGEDRIWGIWGCGYNIPKAIILYLLKGDLYLLKGDYMPSISGELLDDMELAMPPSALNTSVSSMAYSPP